MAAVSYPNLAAIHALEAWRGLPIIVMELLEGGTLLERLRNEPLPRHEAARVLPALAAALDCLHEHGIVHADIKPANIGFTSEGTPKLMDFGLAALAGEADGRHGGTLLYLSPERIKGEPPTKQSDIWALAVVTWECLVGGHPFWRAQSPEELLTLMSVGVDDARPIPGVRRTLHAALSDDASRRPPSASSLVVTELSAFEATSGGSGERAGRSNRR